MTARIFAGLTKKGEMLFLLNVTEDRLQDREECGPLLTSMSFS
jgi:hypothetical protein